MSHENFNPSNNLQKRFEGKLAGGREGEGRIELFDDEEEKKKKKRLEEMEHTREGKESAFDFVNERINLEITEILKERGVEGLDTEGYAKVRQEAVERAIEKMKQENPEFGAVVDEAEKIVEEESSKLTTTLEKSGASKETIDDSRRGFLKMLGLGAVVAVAGIAVPKNAEARQLTHEEIQNMMIHRRLNYNNAEIERLRLLTDDDIMSINNENAIGLSPKVNSSLRILTGTVSGAALFATVAGRQGEKLSLAAGGAVTGTLFGLIFDEISRAGGGIAVLDDFIEEHNGRIDRVAISKRISILEEENERLYRELRR